MKKGIIIIFGKKDFDETNTLIFKSFFNQKIKICLVNNGNNNKNLQSLYKLKDSSKCDISILSLKKEKKLILAVKAGVRFLSQSENIKLIIHTKPKNISNPKSIEKLLKVFEQEWLAKKEERVLLRRVYSISEF
ncbi:hypothetical protein [Tenacibaculum aquimarinum]|uniref:hypothetical protein n=1 Tax=Tenacibaculum aquimarinum TaxID=2910675 RepID=UPI001F0B3475|nr:hypothetical protein [Tenacibaculum aquimarinum]MCH3885203.1 hypothetical protein [Tenacibaculum aquimarinum]